MPTLARQSFDYPGLGDDDSDDLGLDEAPTVSTISSTLSDYTHASPRDMQQVNGTR
jgi:hypothetical protein